MKIYNNTKAIVHSLDEDTDFFESVAGILQGDSLELYMFILFLDYERKTSINLIKEIFFSLKKK